MFRRVVLMSVASYMLGRLPTAVSSRDERDVELRWHSSQAHRPGGNPMAGVCFGWWISGRLVPRIVERAHAVDDRHKLCLIYFPRASLKDASVQA